MIERPALLLRMRTEVRKQCKGFVRLAEAHLVGEDDPSLPLKDEAAQCSRDYPHLVIMSRAQRHVRDETRDFLLGSQTAAPFLKAVSMYLACDRVPTA